MKNKIFNCGYFCTEFKQNRKIFFLFFVLIFSGEVIYNTLFQIDALIDYGSYFEILYYFFLGFFIGIYASGLINKLNKKNVELAKSQKKLQLLMQSVNIVFYERDMQKDLLNYTFAGNFFQSINHNSENFQSLKQWEKLVHPEDMPKIKKTIKQIKQGKIKKYKLEYRIKTQKNERNWIMNEGELAQDGKTTGMMIDITDQKNREEMLEQKDKRYKLAMKAVQMLAIRKTDLVRQTIQIDKDDQKKEMNIDDFIAKYVYVDDAFIVKEGLMQQKKAAKPVNIEYRMLDQDNNRIRVWTRGEVYKKDKKGNPISYIGTTVNITKRKEVEILREEVDRIMRHELRTPLTGLLGAVDMLSKTKLDYEQKDFVDNVRYSGKKMLSIINTSLDISSIETGSYKLDHKLVNITKILQQIDNDLRPLCSSKGVVIRFRKEGDEENELTTACFVSGSKDLIYNMLVNLIKNAVEASPEEGEVTVTTNDKDGCSVKIHNEGVIPTKIRDRFFDKLTTFGKEEGTGLGTYIARLIVDAHGGKIRFTSSKAKGTTIYVKLPVDLKKIS